MNVYKVEMAEIGDHSKERIWVTAHGAAESVVDAAKAALEMPAVKTLNMEVVNVELVAEVEFEQRRRQVS